MCTLRHRNLLHLRKVCTDIIASEQSGVECACACVQRVVENFVVAYLELRRTLRCAVPER